jgi:hypothetical protein
MVRKEEKMVAEPFLAAVEAVSKKNGKQKLGSR